MGEARRGKAVPKRAPLTGRRRVFFDAGINLRWPACCANVPSAGSEYSAIIQKISGKVDPRSVERTRETPYSGNRVIDFRTRRDLGWVSFKAKPLNAPRNKHTPVRQPHLNVAITRYIK